MKNEVKPKTEKELLREEIEKKTKEFLKKGGKIEKLTPDGKVKDERQDTE